MNPELDKIAQDYAHDYRDMAMPQEDLENVFRTALTEAYEAGRNAPKKIKIGYTCWAVVDRDGCLIDVYTHEVKRENLVLHDSEKIVEVVVTRV